MEGRSKEDTRKPSSAPCQNPSSPNCNFCGRTKREISHAYGRSISFPPSSSPAHHRPSPALFRSMSDVSPLPSPFPALWNQIPATPTTSPPVRTSPAPVPPAVKISPETKTIPCKNADVSLAYPASETVSASLDPNPDSDPPTEEVMAKKLRMLGEQLVELKKEMGRFAEILRAKIETNVLGGALTEKNNNNTASKEHEELTIGSSGEKLEISIACSCGRSHNVVHMTSQ
ncbi:proline-rich extensin-like protein EPR1 [Magnolia sinica]|uniref:proline-rich extensin-like protein EPR1 n=1 Tax=Magnolia sinica TaxID=86752 RepID=UPI00265A5BF3|nr:proline-rich extensin-like protein EPR1 [Magnolia sinica]